MRSPSLCYTLTVAIVAFLGLSGSVSADIYDHFDVGTSPDTTKWTLVSGTPTVASSIVTLDSTSGTKHLKSTAAVGFGVYTFKIGTAPSTGGYEGFGLSDGSSNTIMLRNDYGNGWQLAVTMTGQTTWLSSVVATPAANDVYEIIWTSTFVQVNKNGTQLLRELDRVPAVLSMNVQMFSFTNGSAGIIGFDYVATDQVSNFYDHFDYWTSITLNKWAVSGNTPTLANSIITLDSTGGTGACQLTSLATVGYGTYSFKIGTSAPSTGGYHGFGLSDLSSNSIMLRTDAPGNTGWRLYVTKTGGTPYCSASLGAPAAGDLYEIIWTPTSVQIKKNGTSIASETTIVPTVAAMNAQMFTFNNGSTAGVLQLDYVSTAQVSKDVDAYDHFDGTSLDTTKWTVVSGPLSVASSIVNLDSTSSTKDIRTVATVGYGTYAFRIGTSAPSTAGYHGFGLYDGASNSIMLRTDAGSGWRFYVTKTGGLSWSSDDLGTPIAGDLYEIVWGPGSTLIKKNGAVLASEIALVPTANMKVQLFTFSGGVMGIDYVAYPISRGYRLLRDVWGLQLQAMVQFDSDPTSTDADNWTSSGCNTFHFAHPANDCSHTLGFPWIPSGSRWLHQYGEYDWAYFLQPDQVAYRNNCVGLQWFDEPDVTDTVVLGKMKSAFQEWRCLYPNALAFTDLNGNTPSPDTVAEIDTYIQSAQPDILTFDTYPGFAFNQSTRDWYYPKLVMYRTAATLHGLTGDGSIPIPYGQWLNMVRTSYSAVTPDVDFPSESYIRLQQFVSWAFGMTYVSAYTYNCGIWAGYPVLFDASGNTTSAYTAFAGAATESINLGPALIRLKSTDIRMIKGSNFTTTPITAWASGAGCSCLTGIARQSGVNRDILIGYFKPLTAANSDYTWVNQTATTWHFMVVNGAANGTASASTATIRLTFTVPSTVTPHLEKIDRTTGSTATVTLTKSSSTRYYVNIAFPGGTGELLKFYY